MIIPAALLLSGSVCAILLFLHHPNPFQVMLLNVTGLAAGAVIALALMGVL